ncbi:MAG: ATP synthase F1 subunit epsilon [Spirochaetia bacterium]|nr:ATP synthase F1 subunit epsilon [Spirochaetia bacterium]
MTEKLIHVSVISPEKVLYDGNASSVSLPGNQGNFTVLRDHVNIVSLLDPGALVISEGTDSNEEVRFIVDGGFVEVSHNKVNVLVEGLIDISNVDLEKEKKAIESILTNIIPHEKRSKLETALAAHRLRIELSQKK